MVDDAGVLVEVFEAGLAGLGDAFDAALIDKTLADMLAGPRLTFASPERAFGKAVIRLEC